MMIRYNPPCSSPSSSSSNLGVTNTTSLTLAKKKPRKKPDPTAPKITRPCTECGKTFWSWKALFGHMRCHPERQWRGINPPKNLKETASSSAVTSTSGSSYNFLKLTKGDHDAALSLLMLANGVCSSSPSNEKVQAICYDQSPPSMAMPESAVCVREGVVMSSGGGVQVFECSSCKKVFGSHQALGGHRASHKNVKGCFANTRNNDGIVVEESSLGTLQNSDGGGSEDENGKMLMMGLGLGLNLGVQAQQQHQCNICFKDFSSGQALGGHKRYHWEKCDDGNNNECLGIDLNAPAATAPRPRLCDGDCSYSPSLEALDLRLRLVT